MQNQENLAMEVAYLERLEVLDRHCFDLQSLLKAGEALHNELEVQSLCRLLMAMAHERLHIGKLAVLVHHEEARVVRVEASMGLPEELNDLMFPVQDGILWRLLLAGEPFSVMDLGGVPRFQRVFVRHGLERLQGIVWVPLVIMGRVVGVLSLGASQDGLPLPQQELQFIGALASQAAVALSTARLYQLNAIARKELDRSLHKLSMLFNVTRAMSVVSDLTKLLKLILEQAVRSVNAEKGSLMLLDEDTDELVIRVVIGLPDKKVQRQINDGEIACKRFQRGEGVAGRVLDSGQLVRINNLEDDQRFTRRDGSHVSSILCVPLAVDQEVIGVINITNRKDGETFRKEDEEILNALANQAAVAIARTRLYEAAITDSLTTLYIRRYVMHRCKEEHRRSRRYKSPMAMIMCDIDHFKSVNDTHGHPVGDKVIQLVAVLLKKDLRDVDCAGRYGGEEFMLILPQTTAEMARVAAERLRESVEEASVPLSDGSELKVTMSFGVSEVFIHAEEDSVELLLERADNALYESKHNGRNCVTVAPEPQPEQDPQGEVSVQLTDTFPSVIDAGAEFSGSPGPNA